MYVILSHSCKSNVWWGKCNGVNEMEWCSHSAFLDSMKLCCSTFNSLFLGSLQGDSCSFLRLLMWKTVCKEESVLVGGWEQVDEEFGLCISWTRFCLYQ